MDFEAETLFERLSDLLFCADLLFEFECETLVDTLREFETELLNEILRDCEGQFLMTVRVAGAVSITKVPLSSPIPLKEIRTV